VLDLLYNATVNLYFVVVEPIKTTNSDSQFWQFTPEGFIQNKFNGYVLDINGGVIQIDTRIIVWPAKALGKASNQLWSYVDGNIISTSNPTYALDVFQGFVVPGQPVIIYWVKPSSSGNNNQLFTAIYS